MASREQELNYLIIGDCKPDYLRIGLRDRQINFDKEIGYLIGLRENFGFFYVPSIKVNEDDFWRPIAFMPLSEDVTEWNGTGVATRKEALTLAFKLLKDIGFVAAPLDLVALVEESVFE